MSEIEKSLLFVQRDERLGLESTIEGLEGELEAAGTAIEGLETRLADSRNRL